MFRAIPEKHPHICLVNIIQRIGKVFTRSRTSNIGPAKDWTLWRSLFDVFSGKDISITRKSVLHIPAFWRAVDLIATQVAALPFNVYTLNSDGEMTEARQNPVWKLLNYRPNEKYDYFSFMEAIIRIVLTGTEGYKAGNCLIGIRKDGRGAVMSLEIIHDAFEIVELDTGGLVYIINGQGVSANDIIHIKAWTTDAITGGDLLTAQQMTFQRGINEIKSFSDFYKRGANVSGILETDNPMSPTQRKETEDAWSRNYSGPDNSGKTALLTHGVKYRPIGRALAESDLAARKNTVEDIANITGVPLPLLAISQGVPMNNLEVLNRLFQQYTLRAWCKRIESEFNTKLFGFQSGSTSTFVRFNMEGLLRGDTVSRANYYTSLYNIRAINPNEIRRLEGMNPYDGGDEFGMPLASNSQENQPSNEQGEGDQNDQV